MKILQGVLGSFLDHDTIRSVVREEVALVVAKPTVVKVLGKEPVKIEGLVHKAFKTLLKLAEMRIPFWAYGSPGTGKTHMSKQIAEALSLSYQYNIFNAETETPTLFGYQHPTLGWISASLANAVRQGNHFITLDEPDRALGAVLVALNDLMSNQRIHTPTNQDEPVIQGGDNLVFGAFANTKGDGISDEFANDRQDSAFLNRFVFVEVGYDTKLETEIGRQWGQPVGVEIAHALRKAFDETLIDDYVGGRQIDYACTMLHNEMTPKQVCQMFLDKYTKEEVKKIKPFLSEWRLV